MRSIWKGQISFGLVNIPVSLYPAEVSMEGIHFNQLDRRNHARIRYQKVNDVTGKEVPLSEIVKGYEYEKDQYVILDDDELKGLAVEASQTVEIRDFVEEDEIAIVYFNKPYYLVPEKRGEKGYVLLRETLKRTGTVGIAHVVIRTKQYLSVLVPQDNMLVLDLIRYHDEIRSADELKVPSNDLESYKISEKEISMAEQLVKTMQTEWKPENYTDDYTKKVMDFIEKKIAAGKTEEHMEPQEAQTVRPTGEVIDIMQLLKRSLEESQKTKEPQEEPKGKPPKNTSKKSRKKAVNE